MRRPRRARARAASRRSLSNFNYAGWKGENEAAASFDFILSRSAACLITCERYPGPEVFVHCCFVLFVFIFY